MLTLPDFRYKQCLFYFAGAKDKIRFTASTFEIRDENNGVKLKHSCHKSFALFIIGNITLTNVFLFQAKKHGFPVVLMSHNLRVDGYFNNRAEGNFLLREKQYTKKEKDLFIATQLVKQKTENQIRLLNNLRYRAENDNKAIELLKSLHPDVAFDSESLLGIEGTGSRFFFNTYYRQLNWTSRLPRTKHDIPNLLLDIGYTYLFHFIEAMLGIYGFDIYCGVYHKFFYQRKSLVCDIIEPFRCIIDQRLRKAHNLGQIDEADFQFRNGQYFLPFQSQKKYTSLFMKDILERKEDIFRFVQAYYRWYMKDKPLSEFPVFRI